jgi:hypothetical protein
MLNAIHFQAAFLVLLFLIPSVTNAQVVARQGETSQPPSKPEIVEFTSPMILDLPLDEVLALKIGSQFQYEGLNLYRCEGVSVREFEAERRIGPNLSLAFHGELRAVNRVEREVALQVDLLAGEEVVARDRVAALKLIGKIDFSAEIKLTEKQLTLLRNSSTRTLRLTIGMGVQETDETKVEGCEFLGTVMDSSLIKSAAVAGAKTQARVLGATHIVFTNFDNLGAAYPGGRFTGRAYRCSKSN